MSDDKIKCVDKFLSEISNVLCEIESRKEQFVDQEDYQHVC